jgi:hypothetical protein
VIISSIGYLTGPLSISIYFKERMPSKPSLSPQAPCLTAQAQRSHPVSKTLVQDAFISLPIQTTLKPKSPSSHFGSAKIMGKHPYANSCKKDFLKGFRASRPKKPIII